MWQRKILMGAGWGLSAYLSGQSESLGVKKKPSVVEDLLHRGLYGLYQPKNSESVLSQPLF